MVPDAHWARNLLAVLHLRPSRLAIIVPPWEFGLVLTSYRTYRRTSNFLQTAPIVGSRFSDQAHYNEFVESGTKSWALMRRRLVLGMKGTQNRAAQSSQGEGTSRSRMGMRQPPLDHAGASLLFLGLPPLFRTPFLGGLCCYLFLSSVHPPPTLINHPCLSSSARPSAILSSALWAAVAPIALSKGYIHIKGGQGVSCAYLIRRWQLFLGLPPHLFSYG